MGTRVPSTPRVDSSFKTPHPVRHLPRHLLYATSARFGGSGLDAVALESVRAAQEGGFLGRAIAFDTRQSGLPAERVRSLRWHPVRLLSWLESEYYYGAKKHAVDAVSARELERGAAAFDLFHGWSGDCVATLREARRHNIPSVFEIPTWHRHKGKDKPARLTKSERERDEARGWQRWKNGRLITRQQVLEEYALADLILVLSQKAEETFLAAGVAPLRSSSAISAASIPCAILPAPQRPGDLPRRVRRRAHPAQRRASLARGLETPRAATGGAGARGFRPSRNGAVAARSGART